jgi:hypothetical protein
MRGESEEVASREHFRYAFEQTEKAHTGADAELFGQRAGGFEQGAFTGHGEAQGGTAGGGAGERRNQAERVLLRIEASNRSHEKVIGRKAVRRSPGFPRTGLDGAGRDHAVRNQGRRLESIDRPK